MIVTEELRTKITSHLPKGYAQKIATECGVHPNTVYRVLHHEKENEKVFDALVRLAHKTKAAADSKHKDLNKIVAQL